MTVTQSITHRDYDYNTINTPSLAVYHSLHVIMVTTALVRKSFAPHSSCLEVQVDESSDIAQVKATLTGRASTSLQEVKLDLSRFFQNNHRNKKLRKVFKALGALPHLKTLRFHYSSTDTLERLPVHLLSIALSENAGCNQLEILELNQVNLTGTVEEFNEFLSILQSHPSLSVFSFSTSGCCSSSSINALLRALSVTPKLERVIIYSEKGQSPWGRLDSDSIAALCRSASLRELQHLVLYDSTDSMTNFFMDEHTIALAQTLSMPAIDSIVQPTQSTTISYLEEIMISCWPLGKAGVDALCRMIESNRTLHKLTMVIYELGEDINKEETCNISNIATALYLNSTLQSLELHGRNEIGKWVEEAFLHVMQSNVTLTNLELFHMNGLFLGPFLNFYLKLNRAGRGSLLQNQNISRSKWVDSLILVRNDVPCLFYFLSMNPLLCNCSSIFE